MKNLYCYLILSIGFLTSIQAQISLTRESHGLNPGDKHHFKLVKNNVDVGPAGPNQEWNFSGLEITGDLTSFMLDASETPRGEELPDANTVIEEFNNKFYFNVNDNIIEQYGVISCGNSILRFDKPFVKMIYPFTYGNTYEGEFSGTYVNKEGKEGSKISGWYKLDADAYGTLILPGNVRIENVLRLKTTRARVYGNSNEIITTTYRWYAKDVRYPLLSIIKRKSGEETKGIRTAYYADAESSKEKDKDKEKSVDKQGTIVLNYYPNPYSDEFTLEYKLEVDGKVQIELFNNAGQKAVDLINKNQQKGFYSLNVDADDEGMKPGLYHIRVSLDNKIIATETIIQVE